MRAWSIILGVVIFLCVVSVSFAHTVDLYKRVGFELWEARMFTVAVEVTFLLSGWTILWRRLQGQKPGTAAYAGFLYGIVLVLFSNSAYTVGLDWLFQNNIAQWTLAISVVLGVLVSESIISQNLAELHRKDGDHQHAGGWSLQDKEKVEEMEMETEKVSTPSTPSNNLSTLSTNSTPSILSTPTMEEMDEKKSMEKAEGEKERRQEVEEKRLPAVENVEEEMESVARKALEIYQQEGRLPGRKRLMEEAGVSEWEARKTLQELRRKVG